MIHVEGTCEREKEDEIMPWLISLRHLICFAVSLQRQFLAAWELLLLPVSNFDTPIYIALLPLYSCCLSRTCFTTVTFQLPDQLLSDDCSILARPTFS
jgi:hypothetical protein